jgi:hypothetical protein
MRHSERARLAFVEGHAKRYKWRRVALVGVSDTGLVRQLLVNFPLCAVFVVPVWRDEAGMRPGERGQQRNHQRNLRVWARSYAKRFEADEGPLLKVAGRAGAFDAVVLWTEVGDEALGEVGRAWVANVKDGGWLLGLDHRSEAVRATLDAVAPGRWDHFREGIWGIRVRRTEVSGEAATVLDADAPALVDGDDALAEDEAPVTVQVLAAVPVGGVPVASEGVTAAEGGGHEPSDVAAATVAPKRRGGRPKGGRNKPKVEETA